jgi:hypothetical protein
MPNITVHVSETAYRNARAWAAERGNSLSSIVQLCIENLPNMRVRRDGSIAIVTRVIKPPFPPLRTMDDLRRAQIAMAEQTIAASKPQARRTRSSNPATSASSANSASPANPANSANASHSPLPHDSKSPLQACTSEIKIFGGETVKPTRANKIS